MVLYQSLSQNKKIVPIVVPGKNPKQPMDGIAYVSPTYQTTAESCHCCNQTVSKPSKEPVTLQEYVEQKNKEMQKKIDALNSKLTKLETTVKTIDIKGQEAIEVNNDDIYKIFLKIGPQEKLICQSVDGLYSILNINYNKKTKKLELIGKDKYVISSCDLNFFPKDVHKVVENGRMFVKFEFANKTSYCVDINQFVDIKDLGNGQLDVNGKTFGIRVDKQDNLLYVDQDGKLRTRSLFDLDEFKEMQNQIDSLNQKILGFEIKDEETGEVITVPSLKDEIVGSSDDQIFTDEDDNIDPESLTLNSIYNYFEVKESKNFEWNDVD